MKSAIEVKPGSSPRMRKTVLWGVVDQGFSSLTNLSLTLLGAQLVGPAGLGTIAIGFSVYVLVLTVQRTLISQPVVLSSSAADRGTQGIAARGGITLTCMVGVLTTVVMILIGELMASQVMGRALLIFAPWMPSVLLQDYWRTILFRDGRGPGASFNDMAWLIGMGLMLPFLLARRSDWAVVACWGSGATLASLVGFAQVRLLPGRLVSSWRWWVLGEGWSLGRWLTAEGLTYTALSQAVTWMLAAMLGPAAVGGLRAARTVFAPLTLLGPAVALPGLPAMTRAVQGSVGRGRALALKLSAILLVPTAIYMVLLALAGSRVLALLFGASFARFGVLAVPIGLQQVLIAAGIGYYLLLKAARRNRALLAFRLIEAALTLALVAIITPRWGLSGAAWAITVGSLFGLLWKLLYSARVLGHGAVLDDALEPAPPALRRNEPIVHGPDPIEASELSRHSNLGSRDV